MRCAVLALPTRATRHAGPAPGRSWRAPIRARRFRSPRRPHPTHFTTRSSRLGARKLGPRYVDSVMRTIEVHRDAKALEVRRVATLVLDDLHLAADLFGSESAVDSQFEAEVIADGRPRRDAITGAVLPALPQ